MLTTIISSDKNRKKKKIIRAATIPSSLAVFFEGTLRQLNEEYEVVGLSSPGDEVEIIRQREGVRMLEVPMERRISLIKDLRSLWRLIRLFRQERPDMVHSITPKAGLLCMIAAWLVRVPVRVHTFTGLVWPTARGFSRKLLMLTDWLTCACATHVNPEGLGVMEDLTQVTRKPMRVLGYGNVKGIDLTYWRRKPDWERRDGAPFTFLFVGRILGDKGVNELVEAFHKLCTEGEKRVEQCRLLLVGPSEEYLDPISSGTQRLIDTLPQIEVLGPKYGEELLQCYAECDCFVLPSYREGFPNTVIEAGALELPCIVTDINGSNEIICFRLSNKDGQSGKNSQSGKKPLYSNDNLSCIDNLSCVDNLSGNNEQYAHRRLSPGEKMGIRSNGIVVPPKDAEALCDALRWMIAHPEMRRQMAEAARPMVEERFELGYVRQQLYDFYHEVL